MFRTYDDYLRFLDHWADPEDLHQRCTQCGQRWSGEWLRCPDCGGELVWIAEEERREEDGRSA